MDRNDFLNAVIDDGIMEISTTYLRPDQKAKREGGIAGFEECRGKTDQELVDLINKVRAPSHSDTIPTADEHWYSMMYRHQIEWTLNVLSAAMHAQGLPPIISPTIRGLAKAADILGVKPNVPIDSPRDPLH